MFATFYHKATKNAIESFARLFANIKIERANPAGVVEQVIAVPIAYMNKDKMLRRVEADPKLKEETKMSLPRMSFEITNYNYDAARKTNRSNQIVCNSADGSGRKQVFAPVPWNISISLHIATKTMEDGLQIIEQIGPYFSPEYTMNIDVLPEMNIMHDVAVVLHQGMSIDDNDALGNYEKDRLVVHTLSFTMKTYFYGPVNEAGLIKHVTVNVDTPLPYSDELAVYKADGITPTDPIAEIWNEF